MKIRENWADQFCFCPGTYSGYRRLQQQKQRTRRCVFAVTYAAVGTTDAHFVIPSVNQHVAPLMNCNPSGNGESSLLRRVTGGDAAVALTVYGPFFAAPRNDMLIFAHSNSSG